MKVEQGKEKAMDAAKEAAKRALGAKKEAAPKTAKVAKEPKEPKAPERADDSWKWAELIEAAKPGAIFKGWNKDYERWQRVVIKGVDNNGMNDRKGQTIRGIVAGDVWDIDEVELKKGWLLVPTGKTAEAIPEIVKKEAKVKKEKPVKTEGATPDIKKSKVEMKEETLTI
jgi:hypothetical protein